MRNPKFLSILLSAVMLLTLLAPQAAAAQTYYGDVLVAINPDLDDKSLTSGSFTAETQTESLTTARSVCIDPDTGEELTILEVRPPELVPVKEPLFRLPVWFSQTQSAEYQTEDTVDFLGYLEDTTKKMVCLYVGQHCTVWGNLDDDERIRIDGDIAQDIGEHFDSYYGDVVAAFGEEYDTDGDGKLAIMCYDMFHEYPRDMTGYGYTAGLFNAADLVDTTGHINNVNFGTGSYTNGMDCIHLDTYPGMGDLDDPLEEVSRSYSTLVHEFQHLINFSWQVSGGSHSSYVDPMETYLNEAFSMAAEHMVCGPDACSNRIDYFNNPRKYAAGTALTQWPNQGVTLSHYSNSYLFGQYLRTRYGQLTGTDGNTFFKTVLSARTPDNEGDTLSLIADLLETTPAQLVREFWGAVYLNRDTGPLGFGGEDWADDISPVVFPSTNSAYTDNIYNGGARFYALPETGFTPASVTNLSLLTLDETGIVSFHNGSYAHMDRSENGAPVSVTVQATEKGYAMVAFYDGSHRMVDIAMAPIDPGTNTVDLSELEGDLATCTWKILLTDVGYSPVCSPFAP